MAAGMRDLRRTTNIVMRRSRGSGLNLPAVVVVYRLKAAGSNRLSTRRQQRAISVLTTSAAVEELPPPLGDRPVYR